MVSKVERLEIQVSSGAEQQNDPVVPDQGGRMMRSDPVYPIAESNMPNTEVVRKRAYELYEQNGRREGGALDDWVKAESQLSTAPTPQSRKEAMISGPTPAAAPELSSNL